MDELSEFEFHLPEQLIAKRPLRRRIDSRMLVLQRSAKLSHQRFTDFPKYLKKGDALVINDVSVIPARLVGAKRHTGGKVKALLSKPLSERTWVTMLSAHNRIRSDMELTFPASKDQEPLLAKVLSRCFEEPGAYIVAFDKNPKEFAFEHGKVPLPPYLAREADEDDKHRYQTVFANKEHAFAVAAPTAGLHFEEETLESLKDMGVEIIRVTLHVGPGTFLPIRKTTLDQHQMHSEFWSVSKKAAKKLNEALAYKRQIIAVGTTTVRVLESAISAGQFSPSQGNTRLFIRPGFRFQVVDALLTNFHLPKSTLLLLVAAVCGKERVLSAYREAIALDYRFFSYGDCCFLEVSEQQK